MAYLLIKIQLSAREFQVTDNFVVFLTFEEMCGYQLIFIWNNSKMARHFIFVDQDKILPPFIGKF